MYIITSFIFLIIELFLIILALLFILYMGFNRLESRIGILRDGIRVGKQIPWRRFDDIAENIHITPSGKGWQFLIFVNHSLESFPSLVEGINHISRINESLEVLVMGLGRKSECENWSNQLSLEVPIIPIDKKACDEFNVRIFPYGFLIDSQGIVKWVDLINTEEQLLHVWKISNLIDNELELSEGVNL